MNIGGTWFTPCLPDECWQVVDAARFAEGPLYPTWSADGEAEMEKGWIVKGDTPQALASALGLDETAGEQLAQTIEDWNGFCEQGRDYAFEVAADYLTPFAEGPFYAVRLHHALVNTQGGGKKNARGEVLAPDGTPIPHLYENGEFGDVWSHLYQASCNLGGGMIFGRISGANAAAAKDDNYQGSVLEGEGFKPAVEEKVYECAEGQYIGRGQDKSPAPIVVRVTMDGDALAEVEVLEQYETTGLLPIAKALATMPAAMVEQDTAFVDMVAGATRTASGLVAAVADALAQAGR